MWPLEVIWSNTTMQSRTSFKVTLRCVLFILEYLQGRRFHSLSMQHLTTLTVTVLSFFIWSESLWCLLISILRCAYLRSLLYSYCPVFSFHAGQAQLPQPVLVCHAPASASASARSGCVLLDSLQLFSDFFVLGNPQLETVLELQSHSFWIEGKIPFSWSAVCASANTAQVTVDLCQVGTTLARVQLDVYKNLQVLFCKAGFLPASTSLSWCVGLVCSGLCICFCWTSWGFCHLVEVPLNSISALSAFLVALTFLELTS